MPVGGSSRTRGPSTVTTEATVIGESMKAVVVTGEEPDDLVAAELPVPRIVKPHDVLIRLHAAALNPVDYKVRRHGGYGDNPVLGCDGAGVVAAIGASVTRFCAGDAVYFVNGGYGTEQGTYAQYVAIDERYVARKPASLDYAAAAAVPLVSVTAWEALHDRAAIRAEQSVLVHA